MRGVRNGPTGFHTWICGDLFAGNMTSELAVSLSVISVPIILVHASD